MSLRTHRFDYTFHGAFTPPAVASASVSPWCSKDTSSAGSPTITGAGGGLKMLFDNTSEAQNLCLYFGDILAFDIDDLKWIEFVLSVAATLDSATKLRVGLAAARNDDPDAITASILFGVNGDGSANLVNAECDDATNEVAATSTGLYLPAATKKRFHIDLTSGLLTQSPPSQSVGGKSNVIMSMDDGSGNLRRVCPNTRFNMAAHSSGLQPFLQLQKTADTATDSVTLFRCSGEYIER